MTSPLFPKRESCAAAWFNRAMALYHSFAWPEADAACGMAHWGWGMVMLDNPFVWPSNLRPETLDAIAEDAGGGNGR